ncbi:FAD-dependent oxidoreductase, partial [Actibacterium sp.]|uniref:FAD-dependent oxidoreductase n=1 Tax=Actibacterium sp. TaxID=1872125 RepID=UPI003561BBA2
MAVHVEIRGDAAILTIDNPPVNVIGAKVRAGLMAGLDQAEAAGVSRVILTGSGANFVAGADAREFGAPPVLPHLPDVLTRIETFRAPCIAAINGTALGGGLEIALACRYRIAVPGTTLGLPEVTLGVVPGAGGTQRLPRLIGMDAALDLIPQGKVINARQAQKIGLVDQLDDDPLAAAQSLPSATLSERRPVSHRSVDAASPEAIKAATALARKRMAGQIAPLAAIELVTLASGDLSDGLTRERDVFLQLRASEQASALRHVFFAERRAMSLGRSLGEQPTDITSAIVVGGGNMGASIAYALAGVGVDVALVETDEAAAARAEENVKRLYAQAVYRGRMTAEQAEAACMARFSFKVGYGDLPAAQIAIEAAFENMDVKRAIFRSLAAALPETAILASNTAYLDVNKIAEGVANPGRIMGLHFFGPAHVMKLLEVVRADATSEAALATALRLASRLRKMPVLAGVCDGFIGNRILTRYRQTTDIVMLMGALPWDIDTAMREFGFAMGPYEVQDLSGLDIAYANRKRLGLKDKPGFRYIP